jgi:hypothetical protein
MNELPRACQAARNAWLGLIIFVILGLATNLLAQSGNGFDAGWSSINGSAGNSSGNGWAVDGSAGQNATAKSTNSSWSVQGGFWNRVSGNLTPRAAIAGFSRGPDVPLQFRISDLLTNAFDPDGETLALSAIDAASTNGGSISTDSVYIFYTPPSTNGNVTDSLTYRVRDGFQGSAASTIVISVVYPESFNITGITTLPDGNAQISFAGVPGRNYVVQAATNLSPPIFWQTLATNAAGTDGLWSFVDVDSTNYPARYYRSALP